MGKKNRLKNILADISRNFDARGEVVKIITVQKAGWPARDVIAVSVKPGVVRGNHYHKIKEEVFVVLLGRLLVTLVDVKTGERMKMRLDGKSRKMLFIHPFVAHSAKNIGKDTAWFMEVQNTDYDKSDDYRFDV
jgi:UDP-2-acetamido-2,6-beta-L-arabino-hexul-4-ose reductase